MCQTFCFSGKLRSAMTHRHVIDVTYFLKAFLGRRLWVGINGWEKGNSLRSLKEMSIPWMAALGAKMKEACREHLWLKQDEKCTCVWDDRALLFTEVVIMLFGIYTWPGKLHHTMSRRDCVVLLSQYKNMWEVCVCVYMLHHSFMIDSFGQHDSEEPSMETAGFQCWKNIPTFSWLLESWTCLSFRYEMYRGSRTTWNWLWNLGF